MDFKFIDQKDGIIKKFNSGSTYVEIAKEYSITQDKETISLNAQNIRRLIIYFNGKQYIEKLKLNHRKDEILELLNNGLTPTEISLKINEDVQCIRSIIKKYAGKVSFMPDQGNSHYFDTIDSCSKAYIVGFIAADGALVEVSKNTSRYALTITIKYEDKAVLEFIKSEIGNSHKLMEIKCKNAFDKSKYVHHIRYSISNPDITKALMSLGIAPNKSLTMGNIIDNIPYKFRDAFIIGYFDGDGSVSVNDKMKLKFIISENKFKEYPDRSLYVQFRGTREFLNGICDHLDVVQTHIHQHDSIPSLNFASKKDVVRFFKCYDNLNFYYKRKYDKFLLRINHESFNKYK